MENLIERIRLKVAQDGQSNETGEIYPPVSLQAVQEAEAELGFAFPDILRQLYVHVGNGGFGPGYGLIGIAGGAGTDEGDSVVERYISDRMGANDPDDPWVWPEYLLPICNWGCAIYSCLDCSHDGAPVVLFDPTLLENDESGSPTNWDSCFIDHMPSFSAWLEAWLGGEDLWAKAAQRAT